MKIRKNLLSLPVILLLFLPGKGFAQDSLPELQLTLIRNFGYGGFGRIQGNFTLRIDDPHEELVRIEFYLDDELITTVNQEPYQFKFHTNTFPEGNHTLSAAGFFEDGTRVESNRISKVFLSSDQAWSETQQLIVPILLFTAAITVLGLGLSVLASRKKAYQIGKYGTAGGAVCPRCDLPFSRSILAPNLLVGKLVRCPHCGKISIRPRANQAQLQEAENKYKNEESSQISTSDEGVYRRLLDESRYED
jgi:hypothetical protein